MKKTTRTMLLVAFGASAVLALAGFKGQGGYCRGNWTPEDAQKHATVFTDRMLDEIDATDAQRTKVHAIKDDLLKQGLELHGDKDAARKQAMTLWLSANPNPAEVHAQVDARIEEMRAFAHEAADAAIELHGVLTPQQRQELADKLKKRHGWE